MKKLFLSLVFIALVGVSRAVPAQALGYNYNTKNIEDSVRFASGKRLTIGAGATFKWEAGALFEGDAQDFRDAIGVDGLAFDGAYASLTGKPTLGNAAAKDVGTGSTNVAAGDAPAAAQAAAISAAATDATTKANAAQAAAIAAAATDATTKANAAQAAAIAASQPLNANLTAWSLKTPFLGTFSLTTGKTFNVTNTLTLSGTDGSTLNIGAGGTLGSAAFTATSAYEVPLTFTSPLTRTTNTISLANTAVTPGTYTLSTITVDAQGRITAASNGTGGGLGDVTAASPYGTDNVLLKSDGTGKGTQATGITVDDSNNISGIGNLGVTSITAGSQLYTAATAPSTPAAGKVIVYAKTDKLMYAKDDAGVETPLAGVTSFNTRVGAVTPQSGDYTPSQVGLGSVTNDVQTKAAIVPNTAPSAGQILVGNAGGTAYAPVTVSSDVTIASTGAATIANNAVTNAKAAQMATKTYKGRTSASTGNSEDVPVATLKTDLALVKADVGLSNVDNTSDATKNSAAATLTNKRINPLLETLTDAATVTPDFSKAGGNLATVSQNTTIANPSGTPVDGQLYILAVKSTTARTWTWSSQYRGSTDIPLPTTSKGSSLWEYYGFRWNGADSKADLIALTQGF